MSMKRTASLVAVCLCLFAVGSVYADDARIGYVDLRKVLAESKAGQHAADEIQQLVKQREAALKKKDEEFKDLKQKYEKNKLVLSASQRQSKENELQEKFAAFQQARADARREVEQKQRDYTDKALPRIRAIIRDLAREEKLTLVLDMNQMPVLYASGTPDLTNKVIQRFDAKGGN